MNVTEWLKSADKPYDVGLQLYKQHGGKAVLISIFTKGGATTYNRGRLHKELVAIEVIQAEAAEIATEVIKNIVKEVELKTTNWRKAQPKDAYPPELHQAYDRLQELYALINHLHPKLDALWMTNHKECFQAKNKLVQAWDEIDEIYTLLAYYDEHKVVRPHKYQTINTADRYDHNYRLKKRNNLRTYISRSKDDPKHVDKVRAWEKELKELDALL